MLWDDSNEVDFKWFAQVTSRNPKFCGLFDLSHPDIRVLDCDGAASWHIVADVYYFPIPGPTNRGEFRLLCKMLGITLKEQPISEHHFVDGCQEC